MFLVAFKLPLPVKIFNPYLSPKLEFVCLNSAGLHTGASGGFFYLQEQCSMYLVFSCLKVENIFQNLCGGTSNCA